MEVTEPSELVDPNSNQKLVATLFGLTLPFRTAELYETDPGPLAKTDGTDPNVGFTSPYGVVVVGGVVEPEELVLSSIPVLKLLVSPKETP